MSLSLTWTYHGVLAHKHHASYLPSAPQTLAYLVHLLGANIVDSDDEDRLVLLKQSLQLVKVNGFVGGLAPHICFDIQTGYLRVNCG